jgi:uncharacterized protein YdeI (YjbR/CyaY-like superfamily)
MSSLKRKRNRMPAEISAALAARGVRAAYDARPAYQRNDYLGWIGRAVRQETRVKRVEQMLDELARGGVYMRMRWNGASPPGRGAPTRRR